MEGLEAARLEKRLSKTQILEFYLNQVPYTQHRRGVVQAAHFYFNRGLDTLSPEEQLALAVLVRSPAGTDLRRNAPRARRALERLADRLQQRGALTADQRSQVRSDPWVRDDSQAALEASHFVSHALNVAPTGPVTVQVSTRMCSSPRKRSSTVHSPVWPSGMSATARCSSIDQRRNEILGWVVGRAMPAGAAANSATGGYAASGYDTVLTPRQPGSTMKPLPYALALEQGWTAATLIDDAELSESVGGGQHTFHNYSHRHYGPLRLREALCNSLNIPAVKTLKFVGGDAFMERLHTRWCGYSSRHGNRGCSVLCALIPGPIRDAA